MRTESISTCSRARDRCWVHVDKVVHVHVQSTWHYAHAMHVTLCTCNTRDIVHVKYTRSWPQCTWHRARAMHVAVTAVHVKYTRYRARALWHVKYTRATHSAHLCVRRYCKRSSTVGSTFDWIFPYFFLVTYHTFLSWWLLAVEFFLFFSWYKYY